MFSPQNGVLETGVQARIERRFEKNRIGHAFISKFEVF
jgi:hypothetical protein